MCKRKKLQQVKQQLKECFDDLEFVNHKIKYVPHDAFHGDYEVFLTLRFRYLLKKHKI